MGEKCWRAEEAKAEKCFLHKVSQRANSEGGVSRLFEILGAGKA